MSWAFTRAMSITNFFSRMKSSRAADALRNQLSSRMKATICFILLMAVLSSACAACSTRKRPNKYDAQDERDLYGMQLPVLHVTKETFPPEFAVAAVLKE